jgi:hypothetical protein
MNPAILNVPKSSAQAQGIYVGETRVSLCFSSAYPSGSAADIVVYCRCLAAYTCLLLNGIYVADGGTGNTPVAGSLALYCVFMSLQDYPNASADPSLYQLPQRFMRC